jgi:hypothetical protein
LGEGTRYEIVFPDHHVRAILLAAADVDDRRPFARSYCVAHLGPSEIVNPNRRYLAVRGQRDE